MKMSSNVFTSCTYEECKLKVKVFNGKINFELEWPTWGKMSIFKNEIVKHGSNYAQIGAFWCH